MKLNPRWYPAIILITLALFTLFGFLLGFRPQHGSGRGHGDYSSSTQSMIVTQEAQA